MIMSPFVMVIAGFLAGMGFGLLVAWGTVGLVVAGVGAAVLLVGSVMPSSLRGVFSFAILGYIVAFIAAGGLSLL